MADRSGLLTESDGPDDGGAPLSATSLPEGLSGENIDIPGGRDTRGGTTGAEQPGEQYEVIETDSHFRPLSNADAGGAQPRDDEARPAGEQTQQPRPPREDRAARRQRQREGRERTQAENARLRAEIDALRQHVESFEPRLTQFDQARLQGQITDVERQIEREAQRATQASRRMSDAMANQDAEAFQAALDERDAARDATRDLLNRKNLLSQGAGPDTAQMRGQMPNGAPVAAPPPVSRPPSPVVQQYVREFQEDHPWFTGDQRDLDNRIALQVDQAVAADGFDPGTADYWDELHDRLRQYLPHRFEQERPAQRPVQRQAPVQQQRAAVPPERRGPPVAGGGERPAQPNARQVYLSPERKTTLIDVGVLDRDGRVVDRTKFDRYMRQYADFDRANGVAR